MCWARKKIIKGCFQRIPAAKHRTAADVIPARCRGGEEKKIYPDDVRKAFQGSRSELLHQVFHFRIQHYILGKSPVCCLRLQACHRQFNTLTRLCSQSVAVRCIYVCVCVCCGVLCFPGFRFASTFSFLLLCTCSLSPISPLCFRVSSISESSSLSRHHRVFTWP